MDSRSIPFSCSGKTALITGAGSGINLVFAELLLSRNCNVVIADLSLRPEAKDLLAKYQDNKKSPRAVFVETDVTSWPALERAFDTTLREFGDYDIVCPGAGVYEPLFSNFWHPPGSEKSADARESGRYKLLDINLSHPIRATQIALSNWLYPRETTSKQFPTATKASPSNPKRIIHIASVASQVPVFRAPLYGASKFAISGFVRSIAPLEKYGIRVNAVAPGVVRTPLWLDNKDKLANVDETKDAWVTPDEVANAMLHCLEDPDKGGGLVLEVGSKHTRAVETFNDPGPDTRPQAGLFTSISGEEGAHALLQDKAVWAWPKL